MKKFSLIISMIVILIISNAVLAQEEDATEAIINLTIDQEGRRPRNRQSYCPIRVQRLILLLYRRQMS